MNDLYKKIEYITSNICNSNAATVSELDTLYMDSIDFINLIIDIEEFFSIIIPDNLLLMENFKSKQQIINTIYSLLNEHEEN